MRWSRRARTPADAWLVGRTDFVMIMDSGEDRVAAFVQEHRRRLRVRTDMPCFGSNHLPPSLLSLQVGLCCQADRSLRQHPYCRTRRTGAAKPSLLSLYISCCCRAGRQLRQLSPSTAGPGGLGQPEAAGRQQRQRGRRRRRPCLPGAAGRAAGHHGGSALRAAGPRGDTGMPTRLASCAALLRLLQVAG